MVEDRTGHPYGDRTVTIQPSEQPPRQPPEPPTVHIRRRLTVSEAADELGISAEAVRSRVKRGTLRSTKEGGTVYLLLPEPVSDDQTRPGEDQTIEETDRSSDQTPPEYDRAGSQVELVESLLDQLAYMREQRAEEREARRVLGEPHGPETVSESAAGTSAEAAILAS